MAKATEQSTGFSLRMPKSLRAELDEAARVADVSASKLVKRYVMVGLNQRRELLEKYHPDYTFEINLEGK
jgi:hypothetical protein